MAVFLVTRRGAVQENTALGRIVAIATAIKDATISSGTETDRRRRRLLGSLVGGNSGVGFRVGTFVLL